MKILFVLLVFPQFYPFCESLLFSKCFYADHECPNVDVSFFLYTRETQNDPTVLNIANPETSFKAKFVINRPLVVLIHGYTGDKDFAPNKQIRPAYFSKDDFNIISVDYSKLAQEPCYFWAVKNLPTVANCTAQLLNFLVDRGIFKLDDIHVIGFSLGEGTAEVFSKFRD
jgi:pimeloyl-ACP methyl ester carboxylesterase